jgi:hypothetical protein
MVLNRSCFAFKAERRVVGNSTIQQSMNLSPNAANLAGAIHYLFNYNAPLFNRYLRLVRRVLPNIESVAAPPISENTVQIRVWHTGYADGRADLAIPLDDCGTGIGQVLAILFIVVTSRIDQTIIIDEPNSFLHPSASRALIQVLQEEGRHQFVISTHSTDLIAATRPEKLLVIRWDEAQSKIDSFDGQDVEGLRASLAELGVRLSDVLGYDAVIWVEGQTEARCFPMLRAAADAAVSEGVGFVALANTGDLEGPHARIVLDIYRRVVRQGPFLKPPVAISLDAELRSEDEMNAIIKESGGVVRFLPRRSLENFLISAGGIAAVLSKLVDSPPSAQTVGDWIDLHHLDEKYYPRKPHVSEDWRQGINASEFIQDLISDLTHQRYDFRGNKATFSSSVVSWMIANERPAIQLLIDYVAKLAESSQSAQDRPA